MSVTTIKPFSSQGEYLMVEFFENRGFEYEGIVCKNPDDNGKTGLLELRNGNVLNFEWSSLKWVRSKVPGE